MNKFFLPQKNIRTIWFAIFLLVIGIVTFVVYQRSYVSVDRQTVLRVEYPELQELAQISQSSGSFPDLSRYFTSLAQKKGGAYAYEVLRAATLPPDTDLHLLGHAIGDVLFEAEGIKGITVCTQDFRNACSHSIVVGLFLKEGEDALPKIVDVCRKAPGGVGAYTMCFHGLGHGILAAFDYKLPKAIDTCKKTGSASHEFREFPECVGGAMMEIISGGFHNRDAWEKQSKVWLKKEDPLYPCTSDIIPEPSKYLCFTYLTPHLFNLASVDPTDPSDAQIIAAFAYCNSLSVSATVYRDACFGGFGKEFVVLARQRDIRNFEQTTDDELRTIATWCTLASEPAAIKVCMFQATNSLYWGGENPASVAIRFCSLLPQEQGYKTACFTNLIGGIHFYTKDEQKVIEVCNELPSDYRDACLKFGS